jgi:hypothetical protein
VGREARDRGVQPAAGDDQQRETGADLLIVDADVAFLIKRHGSLSFCHCVGRGARSAPSLHSVVFCVRSRLDKQRQSLASLLRHYSATAACVHLRSV